MSNYYIKYITGPVGQKGYPENNGNLVAFAKGQKKPCDRFKECDGFFLYETGHKEKETKKTGMKAIYARGVIATDQSSFLHLPGFGVGERWPYVVKVILERGNSLGVSIREIEEIMGKRLTNKRGGLWKISSEQFKKINAELDNYFS